MTKDTFPTLSFEDLLAEVVSPADGARFGPWKYDKKLNTLTFQGLGHYEVDMDRGPRGVGGYEWIRHLCEKNWVTPEVMGHLVFAFSKLKQLNWLKELN